MKEIQLEKTIEPDRPDVHCDFQQIQQAIEARKTQLQQSQHSLRAWAAVRAGRPNPLVEALAGDETVRRYLSPDYLAHDLGSQPLTVSEVSTEAVAAGVM